MTGNDAAPGPSSRPATERAEEVVDRVGARVGQAAGKLGLLLLVLSARAREEAEDLWAEADSLRRGTRK